MKYINEYKYPVRDMYEIRNVTTGEVKQTYVHDIYGNKWFVVLLHKNRDPLGNPTFLVERSLKGWKPNRWIVGTYTPHERMIRVLQPDLLRIIEKLDKVTVEFAHYFGRWIHVKEKQNEKVRYVRSVCPF